MFFIRLQGGVIRTRKIEKFVIEQIRNMQQNLMVRTDG